MIIQIIFWMSLFAVFYAYFGYPLALKAISVIRRRTVAKGDIAPSVSFIITAYNEEGRIKDKIENALEQDYSRDKMEIIVASDCSTDGTDDIVRSYQPHGVKLVRLSERKGKEGAQKYAVDMASGDILVFSDVATVLRPDGITTIVRNFNDPMVGCVSSVDKVMDRHGRVGVEGAYVRYEMFLRSLETKVNSIVGMSGSFFAARREVCGNWSVDLPSDFNTVLNSVKTGMRAISDSESVGYYLDIADGKKEFERKSRTVLRGITVFMKGVLLLNPFRYGLFSWQLFSHKFCRWLVPFAMMAILATNILLLSQSMFYGIAFILQVAFYATSLSGIWLNTHSKRRFLNYPSYFVLVNLSILSAWYRYLRGERMVTWTPSER